MELTLAAPPVITRLATAKENLEADSTLANVYEEVVHLRDGMQPWRHRIQNGATWTFG